jgi:hypothetical protein
LKPIYSMQPQRPNIAEEPSPTQKLGVAKSLDAPCPVY